MRLARRTPAGSKPTQTYRPCSGRPAMVKIGRPFEPGNKLGRGRPRGSRNKNSLLTRELLDRHGEALVRKAVVQALKGDVPMLRTLLAHILPRRTDPPVKTGPLPMGTAEEISQSSQAVLQQVASGKMIWSSTAPARRKFRNTARRCPTPLPRTEVPQRLSGAQYRFAPIGHAQFRAWRRSDLRRRG